jgi:dolichol-phosphate mannosyltransferase
VVKYKYVSEGKEQTFGKIGEFININKKKDKTVSVILPTYNEEKNVSKLIKEISKNLNKSDFEVVVVDDDSQDKTPEIIDNLSRKDKRIVALHRKGKGNLFTAIRDGIKVSKGEIIVTMDADFSHPPEKIPVMMSYLKEYDLVSGSRYIKGGKVSAPLLRTKYASLFLNKFITSILGIKQKDVTGGFHAIKSLNFNQIHFKYPSVWGEFDIELFYRANQEKFKIKEIPFIYKYRTKGKSKSKILKYVWAYINRAFKLKLFK